MKDTRRWPRKGALSRAERGDGQDPGRGQLSRKRDVTPLDRLTNLSVSFICGGKTFNKLFENRGE